MDRKLKNAIRESFEFPESQHKDEFFRQVGAALPEKRIPRFSLASRLAAAAAALLIGIGIYGASRLRTDFNGGGTEPITQPVTAVDNSFVLYANVESLITLPILKI